MRLRHGAPAGLPQLVELPLPIEVMTGIVWNMDDNLLFPMNSGSGLRTKFRILKRRGDYGNYTFLGQHVCFGKARW
jgi:hypothetical protein